MKSIEVKTLTPTGKTISISDRNGEGKFIWTDNEKYYYSWENNHYIYNENTGIWEIKIWNGLTNFDGNYIWNDGENVYCSIGGQGKQYKLNKETDTWEKITWKTGLTYFPGYNVWKDGENIYYSSPSYQYKLN